MNNMYVIGCAKTDASNATASSNNAAIFLPIETETRTSGGGAWSDTFIITSGEIGRMGSRPFYTTPASGDAIIGLSKFRVNLPKSKLSLIRRLTAPLLRCEEQTLTRKSKHPRRAASFIIFNRHCQAERARSFVLTA